MGKVWVLDTETKGTGANVVPLEKVQRRPGPETERPPAAKRAAAPAKAGPAPRRKPRPEPQRTSTPLPPGHVRKKTTGEIGKVQAVDAKAGTATVRWLKRGASSTVPLSAISRR
ncbi:MAG: hypothetical protein QOH58_2551 [Thermoleophilaceae bacterium]|jgi:hypothetical protein|nr:hypothetical protein [Thermoleophilaceae bacterium]